MHFSVPQMSLVMCTEHEDDGVTELSGLIQRQNRFDRQAKVSKRVKEPFPLFWSPYKAIATAQTLQIHDRKQSLENKHGGPMFVLSTLCVTRP